MRALLAGALALLACGAAHAQTISGAPPGAPLYGASGLVQRGRCFAGTAVTTSTGAWTLSYSVMGFASTPNVQATAVSTGSTATTQVVAYMTAPTATGVSGSASTGNTVVVGGATTTAVGAGVVIDVVACGG